MQTYKKVLFIQPSSEVGNTPRYGLAMLSAVLKQKGHIVKVADYVFSQNIPSVKKIFVDFQPNIVGISMLSSSKVACEQAINDIRSIDKIVPILCGGPHVTCAIDELTGNQKVDYLIIGEAEKIICDIVENAERQKYPVIVPRSLLPDVDSLPSPDYRTFINYEMMTEYPLITSRGCPYSCSFCAAGIVCSKRYRPRQIDSILEEIELCKKRYKSVTSLFMYDDNFNLDKKRGKELLRQFVRAKSEGSLNYNLYTGNFRADKVDEEFILLLKELNSEIIWIGVESADKEVFLLINKGETLEEISQVCGLAKKHGMKIHLNFIIGLPRDSFEKNYNSIRFARKFGAYKMYWSVLVVYKGTAAYKWFKKNGTVKEGEYPPASTGSLFGFTPNAYTSNFSSEERLDAWRLAKIVSGEAPFWSNLLLLYQLRQKYKVPTDILLSYPVFRFYQFKTKWLLWLRLFFQSPKAFFMRLRRTSRFKR